MGLTAVPAARASIQTSATGNNRRDAQASAGFTLVEVLVVALILGLVSATVALTVRPAEDDGLLADGERFAAAVRGAGRRAVIDGAVIGLTVSDDSYHFAQYKDGVWRRLANRREADWPKGALAELKAAGHETGEGADAQSLGTGYSIKGVDDAAPAPPVTFLPTGAATPFELRLTGAKGTILVVGDGFGGAEARRE